MYNNLGNISTMETVRALYYQIVRHRGLIEFLEYLLKYISDDKTKDSHYLSLNEDHYNWIGPILMLLIKRYLSWPTTVLTGDFFLCHEMFSCGIYQATKYIHFCILVHFRDKQVAEIFTADWLSFKYKAFGG